MKRFLLPLIFFAATAVQANEAAAPAKADPEKGKAVAATICVACHAADGNSMIPANPKLAGQHADYIVKQLQNFKSGARPNPVMMGMASALSDDDMRNVAAWFASQTQKGDQAKNRDTVEFGQKLYRGGNLAKGLPACSGCHGPAGAGIPAQYPRIGGQYADYLEAQLKAFREAGTNPQPVNGRANDPNKMMRTVAAKMTDYEIKAVADYVAGLR
ncbi:MAG: cytochrome c4 [Rhodocyclaceae bacterium]|nr:MAG: cytochrome c4 [Rhodocyclaceae bacterium]